MSGVFLQRPAGTVLWCLCVCCDVIVLCVWRHWSVLWRHWSVCRPATRLVSTTFSWVGGAWNTTTTLWCRVDWPARTWLAPAGRTTTSRCSGRTSAQSSATRRSGSWTPRCRQPPCLHAARPRTRRGRSSSGPERDWDQRPNNCRSIAQAHIRMNTQLNFLPSLVQCLHGAWLRTSCGRSSSGPGRDWDQRPNNCRSVAQTHTPMAVHRLKLKVGPGYINPLPSVLPSLVVFAWGMAEDTLWAVVERTGEGLRSETEQLQVCHTDTHPHNTHHSASYPLWRGVCTIIIIITRHDQRHAQCGGGADWRGNEIRDWTVNNCRSV